MQLERFFLCLGLLEGCIAAPMLCGIMSCESDSASSCNVHTSCLASVVLMKESYWMSSCIHNGKSDVDESGH